MSIPGAWKRAGGVAPTARNATGAGISSGVFLALLVTGKTFNLSSFMGLIMVIGIVGGVLICPATLADRGGQCASDPFRD